MKKLFILLIVVAVFLVGCQTNNPDVNTPNNGTPDVSEDGAGDSLPGDNNIPEGEDNKNPSNENNEDTTKYENIVVSIEEAYDIFMDKYPNARINQIKLEFEDTSYEYEIQGYEGDTEYELEIDAFTKKVLKEEKSIESGEIGEIKREDLDKVAQYVKAALDDAGGEYWLNEWELESKRDYVKFEIEVKDNGGSKLEYKYNYESGELIEKK